MNLTLFDLDNTLLRGDSDYAWGQYLVEQGLVDAAYYARENKRFYADYAAGTLDIYAFLEFCLDPLARYSRTKLETWHQDFMRKKIEPMITPSARDLVKYHKTQGDELIIITATNRFVTEPIARAFGVENLIATELEIEGGQFTGKPAGVPCFQSGKIQRLEEWLEADEREFDKTRFYSDSINDLPLLERVDEAIAVNPDKQLKSYAESAGWQIIELK